LLLQAPHPALTDLHLDLIHLDLIRLLTTPE